MSEKRPGYGPPRVGQTMTVYGKPATIIKVHPFGTVDVRTESGKYFRVTGLPFIEPLREKNPGPRSVHTAKWDRCVKAVKARGGAYDPYAVCTSQLGERGSIKAGHRRVRNPQSNPPRGRIPPQLRPYLFKKGHGRIKRGSHR